MRQSRAFLLTVPLTFALLACGGSDGANDERRAQQPQSTAPEMASQQTVNLSGCVQTASGTNQFVLRNVRLEGEHGGAAANVPGITEGAWVRLAANDQDLNRFAGERVRLTGTITDDGRNTIGTAGAAGQETPSGDRSEAASPGDYPDKVKGEAGRIARESMANGVAAEVRVQQVEGTGEKCVDR